MRHESTDAEQRLWRGLRKRSLGVRFRRQHPIDRFVADFCCLEAGLVVEVDGPSHRVERERDHIRDEVLARKGFRVLRFENDRVIKDLAWVLEEIRRGLNNEPPPHPRPSGSLTSEAVRPLSRGRGGWG